MCTQRHKRATHRVRETNSSFEAAPAGTDRAGTTLVAKTSRNRQAQTEDDANFETTVS